MLGAKMRAAPLLLSLLRAGYTEKHIAMAKTQIEMSRQTSGSSSFTRTSAQNTSLRQSARRALGFVSVVGTALLLSGCLFKGGKDKPERDELSSESIVYNNAQKSLRSSNYTNAIAHLETLEARFPFGRYAEQAQLELIYARFQAYELESTQSAARRFIRLHPQHRDVDYAYYMNGLAAYKRNAGFLDRFVGTDQSKRDISGAREAFNVFNDMLKRYPNSTYAPDARQRMIYLREMLAKSEVNIASYYMTRGAYVAAANRARYVVENFPTCEAVADALAIGIESSYQLGLKDAANDQARVLRLNFPDYDAFDKNGNLVFAKTVSNSERSWINLITYGLLDRPAVPPPLQIRNVGADAQTATRAGSAGGN